MSQLFKRGISYTSTTQSLRKNASKVVCIGRNFADHIAELKSAKPKQPFFFLKPPSSILLPGEGPVIRPKGVVLHHEVELALIIGKNLKDLEEKNTQEAFDAIQSVYSTYSDKLRFLFNTATGLLIGLGYALCVDMTARNIQDEAKKKGLPWSIAKGFDTFLPISNVIPKSAIPDPHNIELYLQVNDELEPRQYDNTNLFLFQIPRILAHISKVFTLEAGDIVITGTPKGVGPVIPGDIISAGITVNGKDLEDAKIRVKVEESTSTYDFNET
ncbi:putative hydrolase C21C3.09c [Golovinomyces cichoracearum]|uniref:Putative hydrolase C21C3.09c n=1 Tax=Golovinomyces cichoracearum TaxID=62708 RepID=A0A420IG86_9PEZI|nr:putative hydrolase C21C3.09c [Golovinomyces cichoracearum]